MTFKDCLAADVQQWLNAELAKPLDPAEVARAATTPEIGVAEWAGWVPGGQQMLVAREARGQGRYRKSFEVVRLEGLTTERVTGDVAALPLFQRWQDPAWKRQLCIDMGDSEDTVVWHPGSRPLMGVSGSETLGFVCVEATSGHNDSLSLAPG